MQTSEDKSSKLLKDTIRCFYTDLSVGKTKASCCGLDSQDMPLADLLSVGYSLHEIMSIPVESRISFGCGNPTVFAELEPGELVLDIGSGAGLDVILAARRVGRLGLIVGMDLASAMVQRAKKSSYEISNIEYNLSEAEHIPYKDACFDVALSNCVINLCPSKETVFQEIHRVLRPGGRLCVSDVISIGELPSEVRENIQLWAACVAGTVDEEAYLSSIRRSGFSDISIISKRVFKYGPADVSRFRRFFQGDVRSFRRALSLEGRLGSIAFTAFKR